MIKSTGTRLKRKQKRHELYWGLFFILPSFLGFFIFVFIPVLMSLCLNFTEWNFLQGFEGIKFNGVENYIKLFSDDVFKTSYINNLIFTVITVPVCVVLGLVLAYIINYYSYAKKTIQVLLFIPYIASVVAVCIVWMVLLQPTYGPVNTFLRSIGIENPPGWHVDFKWALPTVMFVYIWQQVGYYILVYMGGLKNIPEEIYEAAQIDGASSVKRFFSITVPMVSPTTFFLTTMGIIGSFKVFDHISVMTEGGPGQSTYVMAFYVYRKAFEEYQMGYANTLAWALFLLIFVVTAIQWKWQKKITLD